MAKIPFDIKFRQQIESGEYKVETRDGKPARIICWDRQYEYYPLIVLISSSFGESCEIYTIDGKFKRNLETSDFDLFLITPELHESEDERIRKMLVEQMVRWKKCAEDNNVEQDVKDASDAIAYLEKRNEQKPATPWTIQDAHPGDILNSARVQATIIFKGFNPDGKHIDAYCALQKGIFIAQEMLWDRDFEPATQVRKDAIFDAMVRKGYLWDAENKRLNKAVQQPAECGEDEKIRMELLVYFTTRKIDGDEDETWYGHSYDSIIAFLEKQKEHPENINVDNDRVEKSPDHDKVKNAYAQGRHHGIQWVLNNPGDYELQKVTEWDEEDEQYLLVCKNALNKYQRSDHWDANIISKWLENRLKSFRPQPHEELDEEEVDFFIEDVKFPFQAKEKSTGKILTITSGTENEDGASYVFFWAGKNRYLPEDLLKIK